VEITIKLPDFKFNLFKKTTRRKRRGTAIVETSEGIMVIEEKDGLFYLPGGKTVNHEPRREALMRELMQDTGLQTESVKYLFRHVGYEGLLEEHHKVYLVTPKGELEVDDDEIQFYTPTSDIPLSKVTKEIINRYFDFKKSLQVAAKL
jgi:8-oxo-dGTP diphosphatase